MTLTELITRVEQGSGSDRQLDADICVALQWGIPMIERSGNPIIHSPQHQGFLSFSSMDSAFIYGSQRLTSSLDAIRALFKARLNGHMFDILETPRGYLHRVNIMPSDVECPPVYSSSNPDIHRAFLSATLKAIAAKEG